MVAHLTTSTRVGAYALVSSSAETFAEFSPGSSKAEKSLARKNAVGLSSALAQPVHVGQPSGALKSVETVEDVGTTADAVTDRVEHAHKLVEAATGGMPVDRALINGEIGALLGLLGRLDSEGRYEEEIRVAKALHGLCVTAFRWLDLVRSLRSALAAARKAQDKAGEAWALNELGALHLSAGNPKKAKDLLEQAFKLRQDLGDPAGGCVTRHNRDSARRDYTRPLQLATQRRFVRPRKVPGLLAVGLLVGLVILAITSVGVARWVRDRGQTGAVGDLVAVIDSAPPNPSAQTTATFAFSARGADKFQCRLGDVAFESCQSPKTLDRLREGLHVFQVRAGTRDGWGPTSDYAWRVDLTAPTVAITRHPSPRTSETSASFSFEAGEKVKRFECRFRDAQFTICRSPWNSPSGLEDHAYEFAVRAVDLAGNVGNATKYSWTVAATPGPEISHLIGPARVTNQVSATFTFQSQGAVEFRCQLGDSPPIRCASGQVFPDLPDGANVFRVWGLNAVGTAGPKATWTWTVDTVAPIATIDELKSATGSFTFSSNDLESSLQCRLLPTFTVFAGCVSPKTFVVTVSGDYTFQVRAVDQAGNVGVVDQMPIHFPIIN